MVDVPDDLPYVQADAGLLERVVANLVGNALRYSPPDDPTGRHRQPASATGWSYGSSTVDPGIPPADLDRVFTPFQRLGDTDNTTGVGLGLALSRGLTEAMGGSPDPGGDPGRRPHDGRLAARRARTGELQAANATRPARAGAGGCDVPAAPRRDRP